MARQSKEIDQYKPEKRTDQTRLRELNRMPEKRQHREVSEQRKIQARFSEKTERKGTLGQPGVEGFDKSGVKPDQDAREYRSQKQDLEASRAKREEVLEEIINKEVPVAREKRIDNTQDLHLIDEKEYAEELKKRDPRIRDSEIKDIPGFHDPRDRQAYVRDTGDTLTTGLHEKMHQKSQSELPTRFNEGLTEYFAREKAGAMGNLKSFDKHGREVRKPKSDYEKEVQVVMKLEANVGREPLDKAYFEGKTDALKQHVETAFGEGSYDKITGALEKRDYETASKIIEKDQSHN
jgi:hypothetical protein